MPFDLAKFQEQLSAQSQLAEERRKQQELALIEQQRIREQAGQLANQYANDTRFMHDTIQDNMRKRNRERGLEDSINPFDSIKLLGLRTLDPTGYTKQGRSQRLAEDSQIASAIGQLYGIQTQALEQQLKNTTINVDRAQLIETLGLERLKQVQEEADLLQGNYEAAEKMQNLAIANLTLKELESYSTLAATSGVADVGGIKVDARKLQDRIHALNKREHTISFEKYIMETQQFEIENKDTYFQTKENELRKQKDSNAHIDDELADAAFKRQKAADDRANYPFDQAERDLRNQQLLEGLATFEEEKQVRALARSAQTSSLLKQLHIDHADTMTLEELQETKSNNYTKSGVNFEKDVIDTAISRRLQAQSESIEAGVRSERVKNFDKENIARESKRLDAIRNRFAAGSPGEKAFHDYEKALGVAAQMAGEKTPSGEFIPYEVRATGVRIFEEAATKFNESITAQAKFESKGDASVEEILRSFYSGQPVPQETVIQASVDRLSKNKTLVGLYPIEIATIIEKSYRAELQEILHSKGLSGEPSLLEMLSSGKMTATELNIIKGEVAAKALQAGVNARTQTEADKLLANQVNSNLSEGHPLSGLWTPSHMLGAMKSADEKAFRIWQDTLELTPEEAIAIKNGSPLPPDSERSDLDRTEATSQLRLLENQQLFLELDAAQPGASREFVQWWQTKGLDYVSNFAVTREDTTVQEAVVNSLLDNRAGAAMQAYAIGLVESHDSIQKGHIDRVYDLMTMRNSPEATQALLLESDMNLSDMEKKEVFQNVILPLVAQANQHGLSPRDASKFIENNLLSDELIKDPKMKKLMKTVMRDRSEHLSQIQKRDEMTKTMKYMLEAARYMHERPNWYTELKQELKGKQ